MLSFPVLVRKLWRYGYGAKGSLYPQGTDGVEVELPIGGEGAVLTVVSGTPAWASAGGGEILQDDATGEILYDDLTGEILYEEGGGSTPVVALDDLSDVLVPTPNDGDVLTWVDADSMWEAVAPVPGGGGSGTQDDADGTFYVATTGSNITGTGLIGAPYATATFALSTLPRSIGFTQTIVMADGTYAEALDFRGFVTTGSGLIVIQGNTTTPANVVTTGTAALTFRGQAGYTCGAVASGPVRVKLQGVSVSPTTSSIGIAVIGGATVILDRSNAAGGSSSALQESGFAVSCLENGSTVEFRGNCTLSGFTVGGLGIFYGAIATYTSAGTITVTGPGSTTIGIWVGYLAGFHCSGGSPSGLNITITGVQQGIHAGINSHFIHIGPSATITVDNVTTPGSSRGMMATDVSTISTAAHLVFDHLSIGFVANSVSYIESTGTRTLTSVGTTSQATSGATIALF